MHWCVYECLDDAKSILVMFMFSSVGQSLVCANKLITRKTWQDLKLQMISNVCSEL